MDSIAVTEHFYASETVVTSSKFPNLPTSDQAARIRHTAFQMELVRAVLGRKPIKINSWFRSEKVNQDIGGSQTSEHLLGAAVDFVCPAFGTPYEICRTLIAVAHILNYNQLIYEGTWVHISFPPDGEVGKNQVLTFKNGQYLQGLVS